MIRLAYGRMLQDGLDGAHGLPRARLAELGTRFAAVQAEVRRRRAGGDYGFYSLVDQAEAVREISTFAEGLGQAHDHVVVLGIGGSALGARALLTALRRPAWNEWDDEGREFFPRLTVLDNVDLSPAELQTLSAWIRSGGGLLLTGGPRSYAMGSWKGTPLDPLPLLRISEDPSKGPVAIGDSGSILQRPLRTRRRHP